MQPSSSYANDNDRSQAILDCLLEIYRNYNYRTTSSGRKVQWDEPGEGDSPEVRRHNEFLAQKRQRRANAQDRLKRKGIVPTRGGQPMFEGNGLGRLQADTTYIHRDQVDRHPSGHSFRD